MVSVLPTLSLMERILFLRRVPLFKRLSTADLKNVAGIAEEVLFTDGDQIALQGEPGDRMYLILSGEILVQAWRADGQAREIARRKDSDCVGEMALISREPRMASLIAVGDVRTLCLDQKTFRALLRERPEVSTALMEVLSARIREMAQSSSWEGR